MAYPLELGSVQTWPLSDARCFRLWRGFNFAGLLHSDTWLNKVAAAVVAVAAAATAAAKVCLSRCPHAVLPRRTSLV